LVFKTLQFYKKFSSDSHTLPTKINVSRKERQIRKMIGTSTAFRTLFDHGILSFHSLWSSFRRFYVFVFIS